MLGACWRIQVPRPFYNANVGPKSQEKEEEEGQEGQKEVM